jgi:hypothetical protein
MPPTRSSRTAREGYGSTNERGKENLLHIDDHLRDAAALR